jgi:hypothetical protein
MNWETEADAFVRRFAARAEHSWDALPGDLERLEAVEPEPRPDDGWDAITVLRARGRRLAKVIRRETVSDYDSPRLFDLTEIAVDGIDHLEEDLRRLLDQHDRCIVRGAIADPGRCRGVRRLLHADADDPPSLVDVPRRWLALDIDGLSRPADMPASDIPRCAEIAISRLPGEFHGGRCVAQGTANHGVKPGLRLRLWFWLNRPVGNPELKRWLASIPVDHSLFGAVQITYTARPIFQGRGDPLPSRMVTMPGEAQVIVPALPEPVRRPVVPVEQHDGLSRYATKALDDACRKILTAPAGEQEAVLNRQVWSIATLAGAGGIPPGFARRTLTWAANQIVSYDAQRPWRPSEIEKKVNHAFEAGLRRSREVAHHAAR